MRAAAPLAPLACLTLLLAAPREGRAQVMDDKTYAYVIFDELEYVPGRDGRPIEYEAQGWIGGDVNRLWLRARGEQPTRGLGDLVEGEGEGEGEGQALYSRLVTPFWNAQAGLRLDQRYGEAPATRGLLTVGLSGLAPYWFEVDAFAFVSHEGDVSARIEASWELLLTQRLVLEPEVEVNAAVQEVPDFGVGSGINDVELAARLRYEMIRELAPYVGVTWERRVGDTAGLARRAGEPASDASVVAGLRWWY